MYRLVVFAVEQRQSLKASAGPQSKSGRWNSVLWKLLPTGRERRRPLRVGYTPGGLLTGRGPKGNRFQMRSGIRWLRIFKLSMYSVPTRRSSAAAKGEEIKRPNLRSSAGRDNHRVQEAPLFCLKLI